MAAEGPANQDPRGEEENLARLLRAAIPRANERPPAAARAALLTALFEEQRRLSETRRFPDRVLVGISALLVAAAALLGVRLAGAPGVGMTAPATGGIALIVGVNLLMTPIAGLVIVLRRRHV
jgi:hypothetical protein